tara:strand:- start:61 stop:492 length:432 start_codon:yes stop_codon:yes gene_type:complete
MFINDAKSFCRILANYDSGIADKSQVELTFRMHRDSMAFYMENSESTPTTEQLKDAAVSIQESTGVVIPVDDLQKILVLFPAVRIKLAVYGTSDTEVREGLYGLACSYFAGCEAPTYGDHIDVDRLINHLAAQAEEMGYSTAT